MVIANYTGRTFLCTSLREYNVEEWSESFTLNKVYYELGWDSDMKNVGCVDTLILMSDAGIPLYVDKKCFQHVSDIMPLCLN